MATEILDTNGGDHGAPNVLALDPSKRRSNREPQLSDDELRQVRKMLAQFGRVCGECPIARRTLFGAGGEDSA